MIEKQTYNVVEAAEILGVHPNTVRKYIARGVLPCFRLGRRVLIPRVALERLLSANTPSEETGGK